jgi:hypothetical protein
MSRLLKRMTNLFRKPLKNAAERYQPEKHYMRGPGPKTVAKQRVELRAEPLSQ